MPASAPGCVWRRCARSFRRMARAHLVGAVPRTDPGRVEQRRHPGGNGGSGFRGGSGASTRFPRAQRRLRLRPPHPAALRRLCHRPGSYSTEAVSISSPTCRESRVDSPSRSSAKIVYRPSRCACAEWQMKSWLPPVSGPLVAMPTVPRRK